MYATSKAIFNSFHAIESALSVKISPKRTKMAPVRYFDGMWMTFNEELQGQISTCLHIYVLYIPTMG